MDTWETKKQRWYRETHCPPEKIDENTINESLEIFSSNAHYTAKCKDLLYLLNEFFELKHSLEKRCYFCNVDIRYSSTSCPSYFHQLCIDEKLYVFSKGNILTFDLYDDRIENFKKLPSYPSPKVAKLLLQKWFSFMDKNGYFDSLKDFSKKSDFLELFD